MAPPGACLESPAVNSPFESAAERLILALEMAGFDPSQMPADLLDAQEGLQWTWERADRGQLTVAYDPAADQLEMVETLAQELPADRLELALMLNTSLEPHQRIGMEPGSKLLLISSTLSLAQADVATLASEIMVLGHLALTLQNATPAPSPDQATPVDWALRA
jgi:predicted transcriptional regulator